MTSEVHYEVNRLKGEWLDIAVDLLGKMHDEGIIFTTPIPFDLLGSKAVFAMLVDEPVGTAIFMRRHPHSNFHIDFLYVAPTQRRSGIGQQLLREVAKIAKKWIGSSVTYQISMMNTPMLLMLQKMGMRDELLYFEHDPDWLIDGDDCNDLPI